MDFSENFYRSVLDSLPEQIAVIDNCGVIVYVNDSWVQFGNQNSCSTNSAWIGENYLKVSKFAAKQGDRDAIAVVEGIASVFQSEADSFHYEYPCHSQLEYRWFLMRVVPFPYEGKSLYVVTHQDITARKLAEEKVAKLASLDGLTNIPNRRAFTTFLEHQWKLHLRHLNPISIAFLDLDHFKKVNDTYGHQVGDRCLVEVAKILTKFCRRPADMCARYGGEEFVLVFGETAMDQARYISDQILNAIRNIKINDSSSAYPIKITASIGVVSTVPGNKSNIYAVLEEADKQLYISKKNGRDQTASRVL